MNVLFVAKYDWTNMGYNYSQAMKSVGVESCSAYREDNFIGCLGIHFKKDSEIFGLIKAADTIVFTHTAFTLSRETVRDRIIAKGKKVLVVHGGTQYRLGSNRYNNHYNQIVDVTLNFHDVLGLGAKNEKVVLTAINTDLLQPTYENNDKIVIAHYPTQYTSRPYIKGTAIIKEAIKEIKSDNFVFKCDTQTTTWPKNIDRIRECDIYIEDLCPSQKGIPLSMFGITAQEAGALGKIVVTRFKHVEEYEREFGKCAIHVANNKEELINTIERLLSLSKLEIYRLKKESRDWVVNCHSYKAVGTYIKNIIEEITK